MTADKAAKGVGEADDGSKREMVVEMGGEMDDEEEEIGGISISSKSGPVSP